MKNKIVAIHQPNFLPWLGFFYKMIKSDKFVLLDDVQFTKNSYTNRNKIKTPNGDQWLTIPVRTSGKFGQNINRIMIIEKSRTTKKILKTISLNYSKTEYFKLFYQDIYNIFNNCNGYLSKINIEIIKYFIEKLNIKTELILSSKIKDLEGTSTKRLISICRKTNCDSYLSGLGGNNYQEYEFFKKMGIELLITDFKHPIYPQLWGEFIPNLSVIDLLFNCGPKSKDFIVGK